MIFKRAISTTLDIIIAIVPILIVKIFYLSTISFNFMIELILLVYMSHTIMMLLITKKNTIGEMATKICCVSVGKDNPSLIRLTLKNFAFIFSLVVVLESYNNLFEFLLIGTAFFGAHIFIFFKNEYGQKMTALDFIFKTYYKMCDG